MSQNESVSEENQSTQSLLQRYLASKEIVSKSTNNNKNNSFQQGLHQLLLQQEIYQNLNKSVNQYWEFCQQREIDKKDSQQQFEEPSHITSFKKYVDQIENMRQENQVTIN